MRKLIIVVIGFFLMASCDLDLLQRKNRKLLSSDYRIFENTPVFEMADAMMDDDSIQMSRLFKGKEDLVDYPDPAYGNTLLMLAVYHEKEDAVDFLLNHGADPNRYDNLAYNGVNSIIMAANNDRSPQILKKLLDYGGDPNSKKRGAERHGGNREYALFEAAAGRRNGLRNVQLLLKYGANINAMDEVWEATPLENSITALNFDVTLYLLEQGAKYKPYLAKRVERGDTVEIDICSCLRSSWPELWSREYRQKRRVIKYLETKGIDYYSSPIPEWVVRMIKNKHPLTWRIYLKYY